MLLFTFSHVQVFPWFDGTSGKEWYAEWSYRREHGRVPAYDTIPFDSTLDYTLTRQSMEADSLIGDTAGGPVVVYLEVCVLEVQLLMSPVFAGDGMGRMCTFR